ncbi:MAG TPA: class I SAM-dependent methyltransferase [Blastocatellia bacterium]|nr:class I SAM-dependent methyltransferase [Blastocatellia bacterium]
MIGHRHRLLALLTFFLTSPLFAQAILTQPRYTSYDDAHAIVEALADDLPPELKGKSPAEIKADWASWVARRDAGIRQRLIQGDEDSLINLLLFGTSFTSRPRITGSDLTLLARLATQKGIRGSLALTSSKLDEILNARINDLINGLTSPGNNERLLFARQVLVAKKIYRTASLIGRNQIKDYLLTSLDRVLSEQTSYLKALEDARLLNNPGEEFYERSRLYRARGLSLDTSLLPDFAIEEAMKAIRAKGLLKEGSVRNVGIVGPGLDFTDKQEGYDFYPQQSIQPFAVIDTLLRLGLSSLGNLRVETLDLSPRVNDHLSHANQLSQRGKEYVVQLPRNLQARWKDDAVRYWEHFGDQIGVSTSPVVIPADVSDVKVRAVRIKPLVVSRIKPIDLNIILQRMELPPPDRFDLIIATNILVYYDVFEQSLAMANLEKMLRPGGFLLSNNALPEFPFLPLHAVGFLSVAYSDRPNDGDHIVWYERKAE